MINLNYIRIIFLKIALTINNLFGIIIIFFKGNKKPDLKNIKKIIFNRKDRIGDAVIAKPFLLLFSKYIKDELNLDLEIEIECSSYNKFIFEDEELLKYCKIIEDKNCNFNNYGESIFKMILSYFKFSKRGNKKAGKNRIYFDLVGNYHHLDDKINNNYFIAGPNYGIKNYLIDYSLNHSFVWNSKINLIESYIELVSKCLNLNGFREYIYKNIGQFFEDYNNQNKSGILIFVGNKEFRNLSIGKWYQLIQNISNLLINEKITVLDDNNNIIYNELKKHKFSDNVELLENGMTLNEVKELARKFNLIIGIDGGGFNYIRTATNSLEIFTLANSKVRSIFTGNNKYNKKNLGRYDFYTTNIGGKKFGYIKKNDYFLPSFDYTLPKNTFEDFPINELKTIMNLFSK